MQTRRESLLLGKSKITDRPTVTDRQTVTHIVKVRQFTDKTVYRQTEKETEPSPQHPQDFGKVFVLVSILSDFLHKASMRTPFIVIRGFADFRLDLGLREQENCITNGRLIQAIHSVSINCIVSNYLGVIHDHIGHLLLNFSYFPHGCKVIVARNKKKVVGM